jgi:hypothetical protein
MVGGATDVFIGNYGVAGMDFLRTDGGQAVHAHKAWFFVPQGVVAVGAGIVSDGTFPVTTSMEQRLTNGDVWYKLANGTATQLPAGSTNSISSPQGRLRTSLDWSKFTLSCRV